MAKKKAAKKKAKKGTRDTSKAREAAAKKKRSGAAADDAADKEQWRNDPDLKGATNKESDAKRAAQMRSVKPPRKLFGAAAKAAGGGAELARRRMTVSVLAAMAGVGVAVVMLGGDGGTGGGSGGGKGPGKGKGGGKAGGGGDTGTGGEGSLPNVNDDGDGADDGDGGGGDGGDDGDSGDGADGELPACPNISLTQAEADTAYELVAGLVVAMLPYAWVDAKGNLIGGFNREYVPTVDYYKDAVTFEVARHKPNFESTPTTYLSKTPCKYSGDMANLRARMEAHFNNTYGGT